MSSNRKIRKEQIGNRITDILTSGTKIILKYDLKTTVEIGLKARQI